MFLKNLKRTFLFFLCFVLCAGMLPVRANAAYEEAEITLNTCPYDIHLSITYNLLNREQKNMFILLYDAVRQGLPSITVPSGMTYNDAYWVVDFFLNEAPELCAFDMDNTQIRTSADGTLTVFIGYKTSIAEQEQFIASLQKIANKYSGRSEAKGIKAIHEYVIQRFSYDEGTAERRNAGTFKESNTLLAYYALKYNKAVCNGYSQTVSILARMAGYSCSYIDGLAYNERTGELVGRHAWNVAIVDGQYMWFDPTWDDAGSRASFKWYGLDNTTMERTHKSDPEYAALLGQTSVLPYRVDRTMHLDIWNDRGYVHGVSDQSGKSFFLSKLQSDEYYTPAMVIWNNSSVTTRGMVSYRLDGRYNIYGSYPIAAGSNIAYRPYLYRLFGVSGQHEITWYYNGMRIGTFVWTVK